MTDQVKAFKFESDWMLAQAPVEPYQALEQAVEAEDWPAAIRLIDTLIQRYPDRRGELEAYRDQLNALARSNPSSTPQPDPANRTPTLDALGLNGIDLTDPLVQDLMQGIQTCVLEQVTQAEPDDLLALSQRCTLQALTQSPDGSPRQDAADRIEALLRLTGTPLPQRTSSGQVTLTLEPLVGTQLFTVPVTLGGQTQSYLLDTGATNTVVNQEIAQQLGLPSQPIANDLFGAGVVGQQCPDDLNAALYPLPQLSVGSARVEGLIGIGLPLGAIPGEKSGALGIDFLSAYDMVLDPAAQTLQLLPSSGLSNAGIPLMGQLGMMTTEVYINNQGPFRLGLDTGAEIMVIDADLATTLALDVVETIEVTGFCGTELGQITELNQVRLQDYSVAELDGVILDNEVFDLVGIQGIIGQNFLNQFRQAWRFDQPNDVGLVDQGQLELTPL